jgi:hypothetical protein
MINYHAGSTGTGIVPANTQRIVAGLYIARPPTTSFAGINLAANVLAHSLPNCRLHYSQVTVEPQKTIDYVQRNRNKKVIYRSFVTNSYNNIVVGSSFNALVNSGTVHPTAVFICPFISATTNSGFGDFQWKSPFDSRPATLAPLSLINLQVTVGGQNLTSSDFGVSTGLISQGYWEASN